MKARGIITIFTVMLGLTLSLFVAAEPSFATTDEVIMELPVKQIFTSEVENRSLAVNYQLTPLSKDFPMPENSQGQQKVLTLHNTEKKTLKWVFNQVGEYQYRLIPEALQPETGFKYDQTNYTITFYIRYTENGLVGLVVAKNDQGVKPKEVVFNYSYKAQRVTPPITPPKKTNVPKTNQPVTPNQPTIPKVPSTGDGLINKLKKVGVFPKTGEEFSYTVSLLGMLLLFLVLVVVRKRRYE